MSAASGSNTPDDATQREAAVGRLLLPKLEECRSRLFETVEGSYRFGDGGTITLTLTNAEARDLLSARSGERNDDGDR